MTLNITRMNDTTTRHDIQLTVAQSSNSHGILLERQGYNVLDDYTVIQLPRHTPKPNHYAILKRPRHDLRVRTFCRETRAPRLNSMKHQRCAPEQARADKNQALDNLYRARGARQGEPARAALIGSRVERQSPAVGARYKLRCRALGARCSYRGRKSAGRPGAVDRLPLSRGFDIGPGRYVCVCTGLLRDMLMERGRDISGCPSLAGDCVYRRVIHAQAAARERACSAAGRISLFCRTRACLLCGIFRLSYFWKCRRERWITRRSDRLECIALDGNDFTRNCVGMAFVDYKSGGWSGLQCLYWCYGSLLVSFLGVGDERSFSRTRGLDIHEDCYKCSWTLESQSVTPRPRLRHRTADVSPVNFYLVSVISIFFSFVRLLSRYTEGNRRRGRSAIQIRSGVFSLSIDCENQRQEINATEIRPSDNLRKYKVGFNHIHRNIMWILLTIVNHLSQVGNSNLQKQATGVKAIRFQFVLYYGAFV